MRDPIRYQPADLEPGGFKRLPGPLRVLLTVGASLVAVGVIALLAQGMSGSPRSAVTVVLPQGTTIVAALDQTVSTDKAEVGDRITLVTTEPVQASNDLALPEGLVLKGEVTHVKDGGRVAGAPELTLRFTSLEVQDDQYRLSAEPMRLKGKDDKGESAKQIGGGTVAGAVVGAITGNVLKGAIIGAAVGSGVAIATEGDHIVLPVGQRLRVRLAEEVKVQYEPGLLQEAKQ